MPNRISVHGNQARKAVLSGKIRKLTDAIFVDKKSPWLTSAGSEGEEETANQVVIWDGFWSRIRRTNIRTSRFGSQGNPPGKAAFSLTFVRLFVKWWHRLGSNQ